jgi:hypothetical protein
LKTTRKRFRRTHRLRSVFLAGLSLWTVAGPAQSAALPFPVGETLHYKIYWNFIPVGTTVIETVSKETEDGPRIAITLANRSYPVLSALYPVRDHAESLLDPVSGLPLRYEQQLHQGFYHSDQVTVFDHAGRQAHWTDRRNGEAEVFAIEPDTRDLLGFLYHMRGERLEPQRTYSFHLVADRGVSTVELQTFGYETMEHDGSPVSCLVMEPSGDFIGLFTRTGRIRMWVTDDEARLCLRMETRVRIGKVKLILDRVEFAPDPKSPVESLE